MQRYENDRAHAVREQRKHLRLVHDWPKKPVDCVCDTQVGRYRKSKGQGCRTKNCLACKGEKVMGIPKHRDLIERLRYADGMDERR